MVVALVRELLLEARGCVVAVAKMVMMSARVHDMLNVLWRCLLALMVCC